MNVQKILIQFASILPAGIRGNNAFNDLFFKRQLEELLGRNGRNWIFLFFILLLTFLALGFAWGNYKILQKHMDDPFTNLLVVPKIFRGDTTQQFLARPGVKNDYGILDVTAYRRFSRKVFHRNNSTRNYFDGRLLNIDDLLFSRIIETSIESKYEGENLREEYQKQCGIIISDELKEKLGYRRNDHIDKLIYVIDDDEYKQNYLVLNVIAVVDQLPHRTEFAISTNTFLALDPKTFDESKSSMANGMKFSFLTSNVKTDELTKKISQVNPDLQIRKISMDDIQLSKNNLIKKVEIAVKRPMNVPLYDSTTVWMKRDQSFGFLCHWVDNECYHESVFNEETHYGIYFDPTISIEKLERFRDDMIKRNIQVDMTSVESKKNFKRVTRLTRMAMLFLVIFALISIFLFVKGMLQNHFTKVKKHLAALKANGIASSNINNVYTNIIVYFAITALIASFLFAFLIAYVINLSFGTWSIHVHNYNMLIVSALALFIFLFISKRQINYYLKFPPGDVINSRV